MNMSNVIAGVRLFILITSLISLLFGVAGIFVDIQLGIPSQQYTVSQNSSINLGKSESINGEEIDEFIVQLGEIRGGCIDVLSIDSAQPSSMDFKEGTWCVGEKLFLDGWKLENIEVKTARNEAIVTKTHLISLNTLILLIAGILLSIIQIAIHFIENKNEIKNGKK